MELVKLIASRLRELRARHNLTQEEAAEVIGVTMRFYQLLESGSKKQIWLETVARLAKSFGLQAWQLIGPDLPADTHLQKKPTESTIHYRKRRGVYRKDGPDSPPDSP